MTITIFVLVFVFVAEIIREQKRTVEKSIRELTREKTGMERTEAQLINDIKKAAKAGQTKSCKIMAKDLVRTRKHREKFTNLCAQLRVMSLQMSEVSSQNALAESMKNVTKVCILFHLVQCFGFFIS
jgi:charged multivesicular body protein 2A